MAPTPVIAIFDIGKTNKKLFLFDEQYHIVFEKCASLTETTDEDGFPCEDLDKLQLFIFQSLEEISGSKGFNIRAVNFSAYGASLVYLDDNGKPLTPLYNYLKPYPEKLNQDIYTEFGGADQFASITASPVLGSLNSGMQLLRIKRQQPEVFNRVKYALHLPQYLSFLLSGRFCSDITSIGCHTALWDFKRNRYHEWAEKEGLTLKLAPLKNCTLALPATFHGSSCVIGTGMHDSSAALIPYLKSFGKPFVLISTGTWCISMNPFNNLPLTNYELKNDCLCYLNYAGNPVKASRLFLGFEHDREVKRISACFSREPFNTAGIAFNAGIVKKLRLKIPQSGQASAFEKGSGFNTRNPALFEDAVEAYHQLMIDLVHLQARALQMVLTTDVKRVFVDGGFSQNRLYMNLLANAFPDTEIFAASMAQATAAGAALVIHKSWNSKAVPENIITRKRYHQ